MNLIDETGLDDFRDSELTPAALRARIEQSVYLLARVPVGVGKSYAADQLLADPATYKSFSLVIYAAPTWRIIKERRIVTGQDDSPVPWALLEPRPETRCGPLAPEWKELQAQGCSALAKATLCRGCDEASDPDDPCTWPGRFQGLDGVRLIFCTEQQFTLNRQLLTLLRRSTDAGRTLLILDEARLVDARFELLLAPEDLVRYRDTLHALRENRDLPSKLTVDWIDGIDHLLRAQPEEIERDRISFPPGVNRAAYLIQRKGLALHGAEFRYLGYDLCQIGVSRADERWKDQSGVIRFTARPYLGCHVLLLSAHLGADYAAHRLGLNGIDSPFEGHRFRHTGTRVVNLRNRMGADSYFMKNSAAVLDFFATLIARNLVMNRTTVLISRKKRKGFCADYISGRLVGWGFPNVTIVTDDFEQLPEHPEPKMIPLIHYGILGVNDFAEYDSALCLNSYYVSDRELNRIVQEAEPDRFRVKLAIASDGMRRRVRVENSEMSTTGLTAIGNAYLRRLEVDPVIQVAGRVRFLTKPREVVFFQMNDLSRDIGDYKDVDTLNGLRSAFDLPRARDIDRQLEASKVRQLVDGGLSAEETGRRLGISRRTVFRRLSESKSAKNPIRIYIRSFGTLGSLDASTEAAR